MTKHLFSVVIFTLLGLTSFSASALGACVMKPQVMGQPQQCWGDPDLSANNGGYRQQGREVIVLREQPVRPAQIQIPIGQVIVHQGRRCTPVKQSAVVRVGEAFVEGLAGNILGYAFKTLGAPDGSRTGLTILGGLDGWLSNGYVLACQDVSQNLVNQGDYRDGRQIISGGRTVRLPASCIIGGVEKGDLTPTQCDALRESLRVVRPASTTPVPSGNPVVGVNHCKTITENFASGGARTKTPRPENAARGCEILKQMLGSGQLAWNDL